MKSTIQKKFEALIQAVDWNQLHGSCGQGVNVAKLLVQLIHPSVSIRKKSFHDLVTEINHQGDRNLASLASVPILTEMCLSKSIPDRHRLLSLLLGIAIGDDADILLIGWTVGKAVTRNRGVGIECYAAVSSKMPKILRLIRDNDNDVRVHAVYLASWFPAYSIEAKRLIVNLARSPSTNRDLANAFLAAFVLERNSDIRTGLEKLAWTHLNCKDKLVRYASAIFLAKDALDDDSVRSQIDRLRNETEFESLYKQTPFNSGNLVSFAKIGIVTTRK